MSLIKKAQFYCFWLSSLLATLLLPSIAFAQAKTLSWYFGALVRFFNSTLIPLIFALAVLFLFANTVRYLMLDVSDANARQKARNYIIYALIGMIIIVSIWGIITVISTSLGIYSNTQICPDYVKTTNCLTDYSGSVSGGSTGNTDGSSGRSGPAGSGQQTPNFPPQQNI